VVRRILSHHGPAPLVSPDSSPRPAASTVCASTADCPVPCLSQPGRWWVVSASRNGTVWYYVIRTRTRLTRDTGFQCIQRVFRSAAVADLYVQKNPSLFSLPLFFHWLLPRAPPKTTSILCFLWSQWCAIELPDVSSSVARGAALQSDSEDEKGLFLILEVGGVNQ